MPLVILFSLFFTGFLQAQAPPPEAPQPPVQNAPQMLAPEALNQLVAPIALYPDALIALILPASTVPSDVVLAARYISSNGDPAQVANQPWDDSVKSLARYPDVLTWMDQNLEWTSALGEAFLNQPADVMNSIQGLRAEAKAAGNLRDTPQQQVVEEKTYIRIVPAQPEVIYVPQYDPEVVYVQPYSQDYGPLLTFGAGFAVGSWLNYDCDWDRRNIYVGQWRPGWHYNRNWDRGDHGRNWDRGDQGGNNTIVNVVNINNDTARQWQPSANSLRQQAHRQQSNPANARIANVNALDGKHSPGTPSTSNFTANARATHVPKPSRLSFTSQGNERNRRDLQDSNGPKTSHRIPPSPNAARNTPGVTNGSMPESRGKNHKVPAPTRAPNVQGQQGKPLHRDGQGNAPRNLSKYGQTSDQSNGVANTQRKAAKRTNATSGPRGKSREVPAPTTAANVPGQQGKPLHSDGQTNASRNLSKHAQSSHQSKGGANTQPKKATSVVQQGAPTQKRPKHIDQSVSSSHQSNNSLQSSKGQQQKKHAKQASPSVAKQNKQSQPPHAVAHQDQHSQQRSTSSAQQTHATQPSNVSQGKGKGGGEKKKSDKKKDKDGN